MQANDSVKLSLKQILSEPWALMKGKKLHFFLTNMPFIMLLLFVTVKTWRLWPGCIKALLTGNNIDTNSYLTSLGVHDGFALFIFFIVSQLIISYTICNNIILGCNIAKNENFQFHKSHLIKAIKRIGPFYVGCMIWGIISLPTHIPFLGWVIYIFAAPACAVYLLLVIYHRGPFKSIKSTFIVMKNNFWKIFLVYWLAYIIVLPLSLTIIGLIWSIPFYSIVHGIINREFIEKQRENKPQIDEDNSANLAMLGKNMIIK